VSALKAVVAQGAASATMMLLSVLVARSGGTAALGALGVAVAVFLLAQSVAREATVMTLVSVRPGIEQIRERCSRQSLIGLCAAAVMLVAGGLTGSSTMVIVGLGVHGMLLAHYSRLVSLTLGGGWLAMLQELVVVSSVGVLAAGSFVLGWSGQRAVAVWVVSSALVGYGTALALRMDLRPRWGGDGEEGKVGGVFAFQSLTSTGSVHVLTLALAGLTGQVVVGALRGAATVIAPANAILVALHPLAVARLGQMREASGRELWVRMVTLAGGTLGVFSAIAVVMTAVVHLYGDELLGTAWKDVQPIVWIVVVDGLLGAMCFVPAAAHRALWEHRRSSVISVTAALLRLPLVLGGALVSGAAGAAVGFAAANCVLCVAWWISAARLTTDVRP